MEQHPFWNTIVEEWAGFSTERYFTIPHFTPNEIEVFLGSELDEDGEEIEDFPSQEALDRYQATFTAFLGDIDVVITDIKEKAFERYQRLYAHYYETESKSGQPPLGIDTPEKHFNAIRDLNYIRILDANSLLLEINYTLDTEHGLEIKITDNKVVALGGIGEL